MSGTASKGEVYLGVYGDEFDPDTFTRLVGLTPTSTRCKAPPRYKTAKWTLSAGAVKTDFIDVYSMANDLAALLEPYAEKIAAAKAELKLDVVFQVVLWISKNEFVSTPAIGFEVKVVRLLSAIGASIDVDTYLHSP